MCYLEKHGKILFHRFKWMAIFKRMEYIKKNYDDDV